MEFPVTLSLRVTNACRLHYFASRFGDWRNCTGEMPQPNWADALSVKLSGAANTDNAIKVRIYPPISWLSAWDSCGPFRQYRLWGLGGVFCARRDGVLHPLPSFGFAVLVRVGHGGTIAWLKKKAKGWRYKVGNRFTREKIPALCAGRYLVNPPWRGTTFARSLGKRFFATMCGEGDARSQSAMLSGTPQDHGPGQSACCSAPRLSF